jgi:hypothetical protein
MKKLFVFSVIIFILLTLVSSYEINLNYPSEISIEEEFETDIELIDFEEDIYDIKIDITNEGTRVSQIWNGEEWQSTYHYVPDIIDLSENNQATLRLRINEGNGSCDIEVKIRDSSGSYKKFDGYSIKLINEGNGSEEEDNENEEEQENTEENEDIGLELKWAKEDIINGGEFDIRLHFFNLEDKIYDIKVLIYDEEGDKNSPLSEFYNRDKDDWKSSKNYYNNFVTGPGEERKDITMRIKESQGDFKGGAYIGVRLRENGKASYSKEFIEEIDIIKDEGGKEENSEVYAEKKEEIEGNKEDKEAERVIVLGSSKSSLETKDIKSEIIYESKTEKIKKYSIYGFALLCVILCILLIFKNGRKNKSFDNL